MSPSPTSVNLVDDDVIVATMPNGREFVTATGSATRVTSPYRLAVLFNWQSLFAKSNAAGKSAASERLMLIGYAA